MANQWLRLWHDMPTDPKWRTISKLSGQRIGDVIAVFTHLLVCGSNAAERGRTQSFNAEDVASALDLDTEQVEQIITAMQGRVLDGDRLKGWESRQVAREDGSAERAKAWREAKKASNERTPNEAERNRTPDKDKDKDKEESNTPLTPQGGSPVGFDEFWSLYPRHIAKSNAVKAWVKVPVSMHPAIFAAVKAQAASPAWTKDGGQFIPHPATWLNAKRWEDESLSAAAVKRQSPEYAKVHAAASWWADAGFDDVWNAMSAGCYHDTAHKFSHGRRIEEPA